MEKKSKTGFFGKLFGGHKTDNCCAVEFEEVPENGSNTKEDSSDKNSGKSVKKSTGCGCGH